jgi:glyoxylase I family protein
VYHLFSPVLKKEIAMPAPFNIVGIDHVVLRAADSAALERFYLDVLGLSFEKRQGKLAQLRAGHALIDLVPADEPGPAGGTSSTGGPNLDHLCLQVEPFDAAAIARHLAEHGVSHGPETLRNGAQGKGPSIYLRDPEGNGAELKGPAGGSSLDATQRLENEPSIR